MDGPDEAKSLGSYNKESPLLLRMSYSSPVVLFLACSIWQQYMTLSIQPKSIVTVESHPARKVMGSISHPEGSPWCFGRPTYWLVGHQTFDESPWCLDEKPFDDYANSTWKLSSPAVLDARDELNHLDGPNTIDRHDCTTLDIDGSGSLDIVCGVGSDRGTGYGFNEVYLTVDQANATAPLGSLRKIEKGHGLHKFASMRNRIAVTLHDPNGVPLVFLAVQGARRDDGDVNNHRMFRLTTKDSDSLPPTNSPTHTPTTGSATPSQVPTTGSATPSQMPSFSPSSIPSTAGSPSYSPSSGPSHSRVTIAPSPEPSMKPTTSPQPSSFGETAHFRQSLLLDPTLGFAFEEVRPAPWAKYTKATCALVVDLNQDGIDDLIVCNTQKKGRSLDMTTSYCHSLFLSPTLMNPIAGMYLQTATGDWEEVGVAGGRSRRWRNARVGDVTGDGVLDLVVVGFGGRSESTPYSLIRVFEGFRDPPFFSFKRRGIYFEMELPFASPDVEIFDANGDGLADMYVVQNDELSDSTYCAGSFRARSWWDEGNQPPAEFVPPVDNAPDIVLLGERTDAKFRKILMDHREPGCGHLVQKFGSNQTLILAQGTSSRPGHNLLLQW